MSDGIVPMDAKILLDRIASMDNTDYDRLDYLKASQELVAMGQSMLQGRMFYLNHPFVSKVKIEDFERIFEVEKQLVIDSIKLSSIIHSIIKPPQSSDKEERGLAV